MAYLHHLFRNDEILGYRLASIHNIRYLVRLCERMREAVEDRAFDEFAQDFLGHYRAVDEETRTAQKAPYAGAAAARRATRT